MTDRIAALEKMKVDADVAEKKAAEARGKHEKAVSVLQDKQRDFQHLIGIRGVRMPKIIKFVPVQAKRALFVFVALVVLFLLIAPPTIYAVLFIPAFFACGLFGVFIVACVVMWMSEGKAPFIRGRDGIRAWWEKKDAEAG